MPVAGQSREARFGPGRRAVVDACLTLADRGYLAGVGGNVALRLDEAHFAVTPSGADYYAMAPEDVVVLSLETLEVVDGERRPSVESRLHATVLRARPEVVASVHTHQPVASALALLGAPVELEGAKEASTLGPRIELVGYGPSGTGLLVGALRRKLSPTVNAYLWKNHGLLCVGASMDEAIERVEAVERIAAAWLAHRLAALPSSALVTFARDGLSTPHPRSS